MTTTYITITREDKDVEVEVGGTVHGPDRDVGIMSNWAEVETATADGKEIELTDAELERAVDALVEAAEYVDPDYERDLRREIER